MKQSLIIILGGLVSILLFYCSNFEQKNMVNKKVLVLGFDGMDPQLLKSFIEKNVMPNFSRLARTGCFHELGTSIPPQSPVAWSDFITGQNPGGHGIFDFVHRVPETLAPFLSTSVSEEPKEKINLGLFSIKNRFSIPFTKYHLPYSGGKIKLMRNGKAFWEYLDLAGIPSTIFKIPANYPPVQAGTRSLAGMGTPDIQGTYGNFSYYTDNPPEQEQEISGGNIYIIDVLDNSVQADLYGPPNTFKENNPILTIPFKVFIDPDNLVGKITFTDKEIILNQGEWSDWIQVDFQPIPLIQSLFGICRFFLKEVYPDFKLYVSPINIDPSNPAVPISYPASYATELYEKIGFFYTQGMAEDTKALSNGVLDNAEFLVQSEFVFQERMKMFEYELEHFQSMKNGFLFFYFSTLDQNSHVFWRTMDHKSPAYDPERDKDFVNVMQQMYQKIDYALGTAIKAVSDNTTLIVMSDHGFSAFNRGFQLNSWLLENGYIALTDSSQQEQGELFSNVDWSKTKAYALGLNGLYINQQGRESYGIVRPDQKNSIIQELIIKLKNVKDPENDYNIIRDMFDTSKSYSGPYSSQAPDLIVGYDRGYRSAWESALGSFPISLFKDNKNAWSGDHCMSPTVVPGVFLSNKQIQILNPKLQDLAPTILTEFGLDPPNEMTGQPVY